MKLTLQDVINPSLFRFISQLPERETIAVAVKSNETRRGKNPLSYPLGVYVGHKVYILKGCALVTYCLYYHVCGFYIFNLFCTILFNFMRRKERGHNRHLITSCQLPQAKLLVFGWNNYYQLMSGRFLPLVCEQQQ